MIRTRRLEWARYVDRMRDERLMKTGGWGDPHPTRRGGTPRGKWTEAVTEDLIDGLKEIEKIIR